MLNGQLCDGWLEDEVCDGEFIRQDSQFRHWITADGSPGPTGQGGFAAEAGRYHLYVSLACPWAHRTLIVRRLKRLEHLITCSVVHPYMGDAGWSFERFPGADGDPVNNAAYLHEIYRLAQADYSGIVTVPVLWDMQQNTIVNNESSEIIRMFNHAFNGLPGVNAELDLYPLARRDEIDAVNALVYDNINNGVYRAGFATSQEAYEQAYAALFSALDQLERRLGGQAYLAGDCITEADWRLFATLVRFDAVYVGHFKCNRQRLVDYPNLWAYTRALYQQPGIAETVDMTHIKHHYYRSHPGLNPGGGIPAGPAIDFHAPHGRDI